MLVPPLVFFSSIDSYQDNANQKSCKTKTTCPAGTYTASQGTASTDRICETCGPSKLLGITKSGPSIQEMKEQEGRHPEAAREKQDHNVKKPKCSKKIEVREREEK